VQALAAAAIMAEDDHPAQPRSMTLMAGPIDTRINPTKVTSSPPGQPISWFEQKPDQPGAAALPGRDAAGLSRLPAAHRLHEHECRAALKAQMDLYRALAKGEPSRPGPIKDFYDEYFAVLDMTAEFYLETVERVFQEFLLAKGELDWRGRAGQSPRRSAAPRCSPSRASATTFARSARPWRRTISARACGPTARSTICRRRRPLRRICGAPLGQPDLPLGAEHHIGERVADFTRRRGSLSDPARSDDRLRINVMADFPKKTLADWEKLAAKELRDKPVGRSTGPRRKASW
jgi:hypothetical protein